MAKADEKAPEKKEGKKEGDETSQSEAGAAPAAGKKKILIIAGAGTALLILVIVLVVVFAGGGKKEKVVEQEVESADINPVVTADMTADELEENEESIGALYPLESFVLNLKGGNFLRTQLQLEFVERDVSTRFYARQVLVRDALITLLTGKTADELATPEGKDKLRSEVKDLVNEVLKKQEVKRVYFTQFVVQ